MSYWKTEVHTSIAYGSEGIAREGSYVMIGGRDGT